MRHVLIMLWLIGFGCLVLTPAKAQAPPKAAEAGDAHDRFLVIGPYQTSREDAWHTALAEARQEVIRRLRSEGLSEWTPTIDYVSSRLVSGSQEKLEKFDAPVGLMHRYELKINLTPAKAEMLRFERALRAQQRMAKVGIILAGLVVLLGAIAGFLRLDDLTKGYYTGWLLAGAGLIAATAVGGAAAYFFLAA